MLKIDYRAKCNYYDIEKKNTKKIKIEPGIEFYFVTGDFFQSRYFFFFVFGEMLNVP